MTAKKQTTETLPAKIDDEDTEPYAIMAVEPNDFKELLAENLGGEALSVRDLTIVKVPGAGGTTWSVPTIDGEIDIRALCGIILFTKTNRAYWKESYDDGIPGPPDCMSVDGMYGTVGPFGTTNCVDCPANKFEEDSAGVTKAKKCAEKRNIFMILPDQIFPIIVRAPAMSLDNAKKYLFGVSSTNRKIHSIYSELTLIKAKNKQGKDYSQIVFKKIGDVENPEKIASFVKLLKPQLDRASEMMAEQPE